jgi:hypothetical protein
VLQLESLVADQSGVLRPESSTNDFLYLMVSTSLDVSSSVYEEFAVPMTWEYEGPTRALAFLIQS